jgi:hypothetical protein
MIEEKPMKKNPPELRSISQCSAALHFSPRTPWPEGLPAVAVNGLIVAGFEQSVAFDHSLDWSESENIAILFRSLYFELTTCELARLYSAAANVPKFPIQEVFGKFQVRLNDQLSLLCAQIIKLPAGFQNFCSEKKWAFSDFQPILAAKDLIITPFLFRIMDLGLSRNHSALALELIVDLLLLGKTPVEILSDSSIKTGEQWILSLRTMRYPNSSKRDDWAAEQVDLLPWPGSTQARWVRQGDRAGIELKLFVTQPSDLKNYLQSLSAIQDSLEMDGPWKKH